MDTAPASPFEVLEFGQVHVQVQVRPVTAQGLRAFLDGQAREIKTALDRMDSAPPKVVVVVDASVSLLPPSDARRVQADWLKEHEHLLRLVTHSTGLVLPNPLLRGFMASVLALAPTPVPMKTHGSLDEAICWAIATVDEIEGEVTDDLRTHGSQAVELAKAALTDA